MTFGETLASITLLLICTGLLTDLIQFCLGDPKKGEVNDGRIASGMGERFLRGFHNRKDAIEAEKWRRHDEYMEYHRMLLMLPSIAELPDSIVPPVYNPANWWKVWVCPTCMSVWVTALFFAAFMLLFTPGVGWLFALFPGFGLSALALGLSQLARGAK